MADYTSNLIAKQAAASTGQSGGIRDADDLSGTLLYATAIVTLDHAMAANDTIQLADLPAGAVVVPQLSHVTGATTATSSLTLDIGDALIPNRYAQVLDVTAAGQHAFCAGTLPAAAATPYRLPDPTRVHATVHAASGVNTGVQLAVTIAYRVKG